MTTEEIPIQFWVVKRPNGEPKYLLRESVGVIDRWDAHAGDWVPDQEMIEDIYSDDSWDTYAIDVSKIDQIKAALPR